MVVVCAAFGDEYLRSEQCTRHRFFSEQRVVTKAKAMMPHAIDLDLFYSVLPDSEPRHSVRVMR